MKSIMSIILIVSLLINMALPKLSVASTDTELKAAIEKTKKVLEIKDDYEKFDYSISKSDGITVYNLNWMNKLETEYIAVSIDREGFIMSYDKSSSNDEYSNKIPKVAEEQGVKIATDFIKEIHPEIKDNIKYTGKGFFVDLYMNRYYFNFVRTINDVEYHGNIANVQVDNITGEVKNFNITWDNKLVFPDLKGVISVKDAEKIYKEKIKFDLTYKYDYNDKDRTPKLVYSIIDKNRSVDAKTGKVLDYSNDFFYGEMINSEISQDDAKLTQEEINAITNAKKLINESEAESIARLFANIDEDYESSYITLYKDGETYSWFLDFSKQVKNNFYGIQVVVDAKTKEVKSFDNYSEENSNKESKYSKSEALKLAKEYLNKVQSEKSKQIEYIDVSLPKDTEESPYYTFKFSRKVNGILFDGDGFDIRIDTRDGNVVGYKYSWYDKELKKPNNIVSKEDAYENLLKEAKIELQYIKNPLDIKNKDTKLSYVIENKDKTDIDAITGKPVTLYNYYGTDDVEKPNYNDLDNSIVKDKIKALLDLNIYLPGDEFNPKSKITQRDFLYLLSKTKESYIKYEDIDEMYRMLSIQNIVKKGEKSPESNVTKEESVKYIIRSLGYSKVADIKDIYIVDFKDSKKIDKKLLGYVSIAKGFKIVNGTDKGEFNPKDKLTREQAIILIYNILNSN